MMLRPRDRFRSSVSLRLAIVRATFQVAVPLALATSRRLVETFASRRLTLLPKHLPARQYHGAIAIF